jgi:3-hydroxybutyryl-CoA dehydrogenase
MIKKICVIGSGVMGSGVAQLMAQYNYSVILLDTNKNQLDKAKNKIISNLRYQQLIKKNKNNAEEFLNQITFTENIKDLEQASFVIENITENYAIKEKLYLTLKDLCSSDCIFGVNTSAISITKIASLLNKPELVIGMHFMNPAWMMPMVEVIKGFHTSDSTVVKVKQLLESLERKFQIVNDSVGFVTNRAMMIFVNEAIFMVQENVASVESIDILFRQCFGHKMGPLQTADLIGLDTILYSLDVLYEGFNDPKYRPCPLLRKMVDAGIHGEKTKKGFYNYS